MSLRKLQELNTKYVDLLREKAFPIENSSEILKYLFDKRIRNLHYNKRT